MSLPIPKFTVGKGAHDGDFDLYDVKEVGSLCEAE